MDSLNKSSDGVTCSQHQLHPHSASYMQVLSSEMSNSFLYRLKKEEFIEVLRRKLASLTRGELELLQTRIFLNYFSLIVSLMYMMLNFQESENILLDLLELSQNDIMLVFV